jgi:hypothetical protein
MWHRHGWRNLLQVTRQVHQYVCIYNIIKIIKYRAKKLVHHWIHHRFLLPCSTALQNTHTSSFAHLVANHPMGGNPSWIYMDMGQKLSLSPKPVDLWISVKFASPHFCGFPPKTIQNHLRRPYPPAADMSGKTNERRLCRSMHHQDLKRAKNLELSWEMKYVIKIW